MILIDSETLRRDIDEYHVDSSGKFKHLVQHQKPVDAIPLATLKEWITTIPFHDISNGNGVCYVCFREDFEKALRRLNHFRETRESVKPMKLRVAYKEDTIRAIRCQDCIYFDPENYGGPTCTSVDGLQYPGCDDFCSNGERRDQSADVRNMDGGNQDGQ